MIIEGLEHIEVEEVVGWIVWRDGREPRRNGSGILFTDHAEAQEKRGLLDVVSPVTQARHNELARRFGSGRRSGHN